MKNKHSRTYKNTCLQCFDAVGWVAGRVLRSPG